MKFLEQSYQISFAFEALLCLFTSKRESSNKPNQTERSCYFFFFHVFMFVFFGSNNFFSSNKEKTRQVRKGLKFCFLVLNTVILLMQKKKEKKTTFLSLFSFKNCVSAHLQFNFFLFCLLELFNRL